MSLLAELSQLSNDTPSEKRRDLLRAVTDLFLSNAHYGAPQIGIFEEIFATVVEGVAADARVELADRIADRGDAPRKIVERLAVDEDAVVATPVLERSTVLSDDKLAEIAANSSQEHLLAISGRRVISELITDVLVHRGDQRVVRKVAGNAGASFSETGFGELARKAEGDAELQVRLVARRDLTPACVERLLPHLSESLMMRLAENGYDSEGRMPAHILRKLREKLAAAVDEKDRLSRRLEGLISAVRNGRLKLTELIEQLVSENAPRDVATVLATFTDLDARMVDAALRNPNSEPIILIARALDLHWACFSALTALRKRNPETLDADDAALKARYSELSPRAAQRALRFTKISATLTNDAA